jgi:hypothetical protein
VSKADIWYLIADHREKPMMFRADRMLSATVTEDAVQRRSGVELAELWESLRYGVDNVPTPVSVTVKVQRPMLGSSWLCTVRISPPRRRRSQPTQRAPIRCGFR